MIYIYIIFYITDNFNNNIIECWLLSQGSCVIPGSSVN